MSTATPTSSTITARTQFLHAKNETYAYRRFGHGPGGPLLCLQHFMGTLDNWDPAVTDALASGREIILFDNAGVGASTGNVPDTVQGMATHALTFLDGLGVMTCDVLGFSLGGMIAQQIAQDRPSMFRRMILVGTAPRGGEDIMHSEEHPSAGAHRERSPRNDSGCRIRTRWASTFRMRYCSRIPTLGMVPCSSITSPSRARRPRFSGRTLRLHPTEPPRRLS